MIGVLRQDPEKELAGILSIKDIVRLISKHHVRFPPHVISEIQDGDQACGAQTRAEG